MEQTWVGAGARSVRRIMVIFFAAAEVAVIVMAVLAHDVAHRLSLIGAAGFVVVWLWLTLRVMPVWTLVVDSVGMKFQWRGRERSIAWRDIESVTNMPDLGVSRGGVRDVLIHPRPEYFDQQGLPRPEATPVVWRAPWSSFTDDQLCDILPVVQEQVVRAGGQVTSQATP